MCHLDALRMFRQPLPVEGEVAHIWQEITKVVDDLHINNHVPECKANWNPDKVKKLHPHVNLMVCEQTFAWMGRFKKTLNMMGKLHNHFFTHCLVKDRNLFTSRLYEEGRRYHIMEEDLN